jgi:hypothetical protein
MSEITAEAIGTGQTMVTQVSYVTEGNRRRGEETGWPEATPHCSENDRTASIITHQLH